MKTSRLILRTCGSLWFAAVLLILLLMAMACATVFESAHGSEWALAAFYHSRWFELLLALLAVNLLAAVLLRYPFAKRQIGFVLTHVSILVVLAGSLVTKHLGVEGQIGIAEGETATEFYDGNVGALTVFNRDDQTQAGIDLHRPAFGGFRAVDHPRAPTLSLGNLRIEIEGYLPDSVSTQQVFDDHPQANPAVEISMSTAEHEHSFWVFGNQSISAGPLDMAYRVVSDGAELQRLLAEPSAGQSGSPGTAQIQYQGSTYEIPVGPTPGQPVPLGNTGYTARVLRYLPHAMVGAGNKLTDASDQPVNPAIEVDIAGPQGSKTHVAFARFPDFGSMHGRKQLDELKVSFVAASPATLPSVPVQVLGGPEGEVYLRFHPQGGEVVTRQLNLGEAVDSPWPGIRFAVLRRLDHARIEQSVTASEFIRQNRSPALLLKLTAGEETRQIGIQKHRSSSLTMDGTDYELRYQDKEIPLGFALTLNQFRIGYYPGEQRPRSFESHVDLADPATGRTQSRVISMNHPVKHAGYSLYQSSYKQSGDRAVSFLSVARDPGQPIVFAGYVSVMIGMITLLITRVRDRRRAASAANPPPGNRTAVTGKTR